MNQSAALTTRADGWRSALPIALVLVALLVVFWDTATAMVGIWSRSDTFAHAFLVPPIVAWMVWRQRARLVAMPLKPAVWVLQLLVAVCVLWLLGELASMNSVTQFAMVSLLVLSVPAVCGTAVARTLLFPLLFLYFAVPLGDFLLPIMMEGTADFTVAAVQLSGVPVYREGLQFVIPSGNWSVVEACSGVRYLIASFMVGTLFAYLNYRSTVRRAIFMAMSLVVPVLANWLRAYMIVMLGHLSGNTLAVGVDHLIYGWVFFGIVIGLMFMIGARWSEPDEPMRPVLAPFSMPIADAATPTRVWVVAVAILVLALGTQAIAWRLDKTSGGPDVELKLPSPLGADWQEAPAVTTWLPAFKGARSSASRTYESAGQVAGVWAGYYRHQGYENKLVTSTNFLVAPNDVGWRMVDSGTVQVKVGSMTYRFRTAVVRASADEGTTTAKRLLVWHHYWIGGHFTSSDARAKFQLALNRLLGQGDDAASLMFFTPLGNDPEVAAQTLQHLIASQLPEIERTLLAVQGEAVTKP